LSKFIQNILGNYAKFRKNLGKI